MEPFEQMKYKKIKINENGSVDSDITFKKIDVSKKEVALFCNAGLGNLINFTPVVSFLCEEHVCDIYIVNNQVEGAPAIFAGFKNVGNIYTLGPDDIANIDVSKYRFVVSSRFFDRRMFNHDFSYGGDIRHNIHEALDNFKAVIQLYREVYNKEIKNLPSVIISHNRSTDIELPKNCIGIHAGWGGNREIWEKKSYKNWKEVAELLWNRGYKTVTFGLDSDRQGWEDNENNIDFIGKLSIPELGPVMTQLIGFASANSGLSHYAAAVGLKVVTLFGPTRDVEDMPLSNNAKIIRTKECRHAPCKYTTRWDKCKKYRCMFFDPSEVAQTIIDHIGK